MISNRQAGMCMSMTNDPSHASFMNIFAKESRSLFVDLSFFYETIEQCGVIER
jgi:hypothetical protein